MSSPNHRPVICGGGKHKKHVRVTPPGRGVGDAVAGEGVSARARE